MVIDLRKQKRVIEIKLEKIGLDNSLDNFVDDLIEDLKIVCEQRKLEKIKIEVILK